MMSTIITLLLMLYSTVLICSWLIYKRLQSAKRFKKTLSLQNQLTRTLTFQVKMPSNIITKFITQMHNKKLEKYTGFQKKGIYTNKKMKLQTILLI